MIIEVTSVKALDGFRVRLTFDDGSTGTVGLHPFLWGEQFEPLHDPARFGEVFLDAGMGTIAWPNGADLAASKLYEHLSRDDDAEAQPAELTASSKDAATR